MNIFLQPGKSQLFFANLNKETFSLQTSELLLNGGNVSSEWLTKKVIRVGKKNSGSDAMTCDDRGVLYYRFSVTELKLRHMSLFPCLAASSRMEPSWNGI